MKEWPISERRAAFQTGKAQESSNMIGRCLALFCLIALLIPSISLYGCAAATQPALIPTASIPKTGGLQTFAQPGEAAPASGCNYYSNGDVLCSSNCSGYEKANPDGSYVAYMTCGGSGVSFPVSGGASAGLADPEHPSGGGGIATLPPPYSKFPILTPSERIWSAAIKTWSTLGKRGATRHLYKAPYRLECVAALQYVLHDIAGLSNIPSSTTDATPTIGVDALLRMLPMSGYSETSSPGPGDIAVMDGPNDGHVGICMNNGCVDILSNSSGDGSFTWYATPSAYINYYRGGVTITYFHHD